MTGADREAREAREAARDAIVSAAYGLAGAAEGNVSPERLAEHQAWLCDTYVERLVDAVDAHSALVQGGDRDVIATGGVMLHPTPGGWVAETGEGFWALPTSDRALAQRWADEDESVVDLLADAGCYATLTEAAAALDGPQATGGDQ